MTPVLDVFFLRGEVAAAGAGGGAGGAKIPIRTLGYLARLPFRVDINYSTELDHMANIFL